MVNTSSAFSKPGIHLSSVWREVGVLLLTASLFLLPWFQDGRSPAITGVELITHGGWPVILAYITVWLSYGLSKFSNKKWMGMIVLVIAWVLYIYLQWTFTVVGGRFVDSLGRGATFIDARYPTMAGVWVNWLGLISLTLGLFLAESEWRGKTAVILAGFGAFLGLCLTGWLAYDAGLWPYLMFWPRTAGPIWHEILGGLRLLILPLAGAGLGAWIAFRGEPKSRMA
jgi:hypothetical protein